MNVLEFTVVGVAQTKGSGRAVVSKTTGKAFYKPDNPKTKDWQHTIAQSAALAMRMNGMQQFVEGGLYFEIQFYLPRPKTLLTKTKAPLTFHHTKKPDLDKLIRAAKDALTGVAWLDDSQVVHVVARKLYCAAGEPTRAAIRVQAAMKETHAQATLV